MTSFDCASVNSDFYGSFEANPFAWATYGELTQGHPELELLQIGIEKMYMLYTYMYIYTCMLDVHMYVYTYTGKMQQHEYSFRVGNHCNLPRAPLPFVANSLRYYGSGFPT